MSGNFIEKGKSEFISVVIWQIPKFEQIKNRSLSPIKIKKSHPNLIFLDGFNLINESVK